MDTKELAIFVIVVAWIAIAVLCGVKLRRDARRRHRRQPNGQRRELDLRGNDDR
jgi:hypothetical protein